MTWSGHEGRGAGEWFAMSLMMIVFWGALVALVVWLVRPVRRDHRDAATPSSSRADEVLAERYARGEIDDEEYTRRRRLLHEPGAPR